jgi:hypothetical protein
MSHDVGNVPNSTEFKLVVFLLWAKFNNRRIYIYIYIYLWGKVTRIALISKYAQKPNEGKGTMKFGWRWMNRECSNRWY